MHLQANFQLRREGFEIDLELDVSAAGFLGVYGESGAGKTTLLRCIAGLERPDRGFLALDGVVWQDESRAIFVSPHQRGASMVFQDGRLFPHLSVLGNLRYGLKRRRSEKLHVDLDQVIEIFGIGSLLMRRPNTLSGGEQQRVAIGRAILAGSNLALMDEPLASLDNERKREIIPFLRKLRALGTPIIYVTHNPEELLMLAETVVVIRRGRVLGVGPAEEMVAVAAREASLDSTTIATFAGRVSEFDPVYRLVAVDTSAGTFWAVGQELPRGESVTMRIRAEDVTLLSSPITNSALNTVKARVGEIETNAGPWVQVTLKVGEEKLLARLSRKTWDDLSLQPDDQTFAQIHAAWVSKND